MRASPVLAVLLVLFMASAPPAAAEPVAGVPGVVEVGTIDPSSTESEERGGHNETREPVHERNVTRTCAAEGSGGECLFWLEETREADRIHEDDAQWRRYERHDDNRAGHFVDAAGSAVVVRVARGDVRSVEEASTRGHRREETRDAYANNLGESRENATSRSHDHAGEARRHETVERSGADAAVATAAAGGTAGAQRDEDGATRERSSASSDASNHSHAHAFGIPLSSHDDAQASQEEARRDAFWNETAAFGRVFLVVPGDAPGTVDLVGFRLSTGDRSEEASSSSRAATGREERAFGYVMEAEDGTAGHDAFARSHEAWLHLTFDAAGGLVTGSAKRDHGSAERERADATTHDEEVLAIPMSGQDREERATAASSWETFEARLDAAEGLGSLRLATWETSEEANVTSREEERLLDHSRERTTTNASSATSRGAALHLRLADGAVWLDIERETVDETTTSEQENRSSWAPETRSGSTTSERRERAHVGAGAADESVGAQRETREWTTRRWTHEEGETQEEVEQGSSTETPYHLPATPA